MSMFSPKIFRLFVALIISAVGNFLPFCFIVFVVLVIFVLFVLFLITVMSFSLLFLCSFRAIISIYRRYLQCLRVLFLLLFLTHIICLCHLWDVRPYATLLDFLFSAPFVEVLPSSTSKWSWVSYKRSSPGVIPFMIYLLYSLVLGSFLAFLRYFLKKFFHLNLFDGDHFQYSWVLVSFHFSERSDFFWCGRSISSIPCRFSLFIICMAHFYMSNSIPISWLYILTACIRVANFCSVLTNSLMSSTYIRCSSFSFDFVNLYSPVHFQVCDWVA